MSEMKIFLSAILAVLLAVSPAWAAITVGNTASTDSTVSTSISLTMGAGANRLLLVGVARRSLTDTSGITWNGVAMTKLGQDEANTSGCELWYLVNPDIGSHTVAITLGVHFIGIAMALAGVHQTTPLGVLVSGNSAGATSATVDVSSTSGELVVDVLATAYAAGEITSEHDLVPGAGQTENNDTKNSDFATVSGEQGSMSREAGASTTTMSWSWTVSNPYNQCAVAVKPAPTFVPSKPIFLD
jgi:hypothetical protein